MAGRKKKGTCVCPICSESILDTIKTKKGHDGLFCEGVCDSWVDQCCAGRSRSTFAELQNSTESFHCPHCQLKLCRSDLWQTVNSLKDSVTRLESRLDDSQPVLVQSTDLPVPSITPVPPPVQPATPDAPAVSSPNIPTTNDQITTIVSSYINEEKEKAKRKLNLILHNVWESTSEDGLARKKTSIMSHLCFNSIWM